GEDVRRLVNRALPGGLDLKADARGFGAQLLRLGLAFGFAPRGLGAVLRRILLRLRLNLQLDCLALGRLGGFDELDALVAFGNLGFPGCGDLFLRRNRLGARFVRFGLRLAFLAALVLDRDLLLLPGDLDGLRLRDARLLNRAVGLDLLGIDQ